MGETIAPKNIPNLNHILCSGVNNLELRIPKIKKIIDKLNDQNLTSSSYFKGQRATIKNTKKNTNPKLLFDEVFILEFDVIINYNLIIYYIIMNNKLIICYYLKYIKFNFFSKINLLKILR